MKTTITKELISEPTFAGDREKRLLGGFLIGRHCELTRLCDPDGTFRSLNQADGTYDPTVDEPEDNEGVNEGQEAL
jgi:hypothetical protein